MQKTAFRGLCDYLSRPFSYPSLSSGHWIETVLSMGGIILVYSNRHAHWSRYLNSPFSITVLLATGPPGFTPNWEYQITLCYSTQELFADSTVRSVCAICLRERRSQQSYPWIDVLLRQTGWIFASQKKKDESWVSYYHSLQWGTKSHRTPLQAELPASCADPCSVHSLWTLQIDGCRGRGGNAFLHLWERELFTFHVQVCFTS